MMTFDFTRFQKALTECAVRSKRTLPEVLNGHMLAIGINAFNATPKANRGTIEAQLGATTTERVSKKTGKTRRSVKYSPTPLVYALVNWSRARAGESPVPREEMKAAARKLISGRLKAVGSLRAGWAKGLRILSAAVHQSAGVEPGPRVKLAGGATPARNGWNPVVEMEYDVSVLAQKGGDPKGEREIDPRCESALRQAFEKETASMEQHLAQKLQEQFDAVNAK